jgi:hypothetical protein
MGGDAFSETAQGRCEGTRQGSGTMPAEGRPLYLGEDLVAPMEKLLYGLEGVNSM